MTVASSSRGPVTSGLDRQQCKRVTLLQRSTEADGLFILRVQGDTYEVLGVSYVHGL